MPPVTPLRMVIILGAIIAIGPLAIDTYLPALPSMADSFKVPVHTIELSISVYLLGVALGQAVGGPLSDHLGRRQVALVGVTLFILSAVMIAMTSQLSSLFIWRFIQALGGGATIVVAAATVRDHFNGEQAARVLTGMGLVMLSAPLIAPALGALLLTFQGWRSIFWAMAGYGVLLTGVIYRGLPRTTPSFAAERTRAGRRTTFLTLFSGYGRVVKQRKAMGFILANGLSFAAMFAFITDAAFLYMRHFALTPQQFPLLFGINIVAMLCFNRLNTRLLRVYHSQHIMAVALLAQCTAIVALLALWFGGYFTLGWVIPLMMVAAGSVAIIIPNAIACFLSFFDRDSGSATGLNGALQFLMAGSLGSLIGFFHSNTPLTMLTIMLIASLMAVGCFFSLTKDTGQAVADDA